MSNRLIDTATTADWDWVHEDGNLALMQTAAAWFANVYKVDRDDLLQDALTWVSVRPNRRRDTAGLRGAVKKVAQDMMMRQMREPATPLEWEV